MLTPRYYFSDEFRKFEKMFNEKSLGLEHFKKGDYLCGVEEPMDTIFYIVGGTVKLSILHESGHEKNFSFHGPGTMVPFYYPGQFKLEKSLLLTAITNVDALSFNKAYFTDILKENHELYNALLDVFVKLVNLLMYDSANQLFNNGLVKTSNFLYSYLKIGESKNNVINISQEELASIVGLNRINAAKYLKILRDRKIISTSRNKINILDEDELLCLCSNEVHYLKE